ncbi:hypothetical protein Tco_0337516 [Tanacetum coccineum]
MGNNNKQKIALGSLAPKRCHIWHSALGLLNLEQIIKEIPVPINPSRHRKESSKKINLRTMPPKRTSTSKVPAMTQAAIKKLVADSVSAALEAQAANMAILIIREKPDQETLLIAKKCSYQRVHELPTTQLKVKFVTGTLTEEALSWCNSFSQPIGIEEAYKITWVEFKKLLIKKYCPQTEVPEDGRPFYH